MKEFVNQCDVVNFTWKYDNVVELIEDLPKSISVIYNGSAINPIIVGEDADVALAAKDSVIARLYNSGQDCMAPACIFVDKCISERFMDDSKKKMLPDLFWEMNEITSKTESKSETQITETDDGNGNNVQTETTVTRTYLCITVVHKTVDEMSQKYGFNQEQKDYLSELLKDENNSLWSMVLYGINYSDDQIVTVALSQIGNVGGTPYWSWYGFGSRVEWCACFVSWCANECGYIDTGVIPKYAG